VFWRKTALSAQAARDAPLARGLQRLTLILAVSVTLLGAAAALLTWQMTRQIERLNAITALENTQTLLEPALEAADELLTAESAAPIRAELTSLREQLIAFNALDAGNADAASALVELDAALSLLSQMQETSARGHTALADVRHGVKLFRDESVFWRQRVNAQRLFSTLELEEAELTENRVKGDVIRLSRSIFAATGIKNEIEAAIRYNLSGSSDVVPLQRVTLSSLRIPSACAAPGDDGTACRPSNQRVHNALDKLASSSAERLPVRIDSAHRALAAYVRTGESRFRALSEEMDVAASVTTELRAEVGEADQNFNRLRLLATLLDEINQRLSRLEAGDYGNISAKDRRLRTIFTKIHLDVSRTANRIATGNFIKVQLDRIYADLKDAWGRAYADLKLYSQMQNTLDAGITQVTRDLEALANNTRARANVTVGLISTTALTAMLLLAVFAVGLFWGAKPLWRGPWSGRRAQSWRSPMVFQSVRCASTAGRWGLAR
jgi:hypothetical protein